MTFIQTKQLIKTFKTNGITTQVLNGISISVNKGQTLAIVGSSGAGKSTLLHLLGGLDEPSSGEVIIDGENIYNHSDARLSDFRNKKMGFIFQFHHLLSDFTAVENIMMPLLIAKKNSKESLEKAKIWFEKIGLTNRMHHKPSELSGGEQQRVAIARALINEPEILLADEPTGNLDEQTGLKVFDLLLALNKEIKTTLIMVTHNNDLARRLDAVLHMKNGKIVD